MRRRGRLGASRDARGLVRPPRLGARCAAALVLVAAVVAGAPRGHAAPAVSPHVKKAAGEHFQRGRKLYEQGRWDEALDEFRAGYELAKLPAFLVNIGQCQRKLNELDDAAKSYEEFLASGSKNATLRGEVEEALADVRAELAKKKPRRPAASASAEPRRSGWSGSAEPRRAPSPAPAEPRRVATATPEPRRSGWSAAPEEGRSGFSSTPEPAPEPAAEPAPAVPAAALTAAPAEKPKKSRAWVAGIVVPLVLGAVAAGVAVAVIETRPTVQPGSLGLLDGRR